MITISHIYNKVTAVVMLGVALSLTGCTESFLNPDTDDVLKRDEYISDNTELYTGFVGLITKMQAVGDKEIYLTDTRAELLEPTVNTGAELRALYNYDDNLQGNSYASPAAYYDLIIACNDYLNKAEEYSKQPQVDEELCNSLISSAVRVKVWAYKTIGEIYGEAAWFDEPITSVDNFLASGYELLTMEQVVDKCLSLMDNGYNGVPSNLSVNWIAWLDPDNVSKVASSSFRKWNYIVPPYIALYSELALWKGAYLDAAGNSAASETYYKTVADLLLSSGGDVNSNDGGLNTFISNESMSRTNPYWCPNAGTAGRYSYLWLNSSGPYAPENVCAILYDYSNSQTNALVKHFCSDSPAEYLLHPCDDVLTNIFDTSDKRYTSLVGSADGSSYIKKFRPNGGTSGLRTEAYKDDVHIYLYRATQYHLMLCEALNQLARFTALDCVLNNGITGDNMRELIQVDSVQVRGLTTATPVPEADLVEWEGFTRDWTSQASWGTRKYPVSGLRNAYSLSARTILTKETAALATAKRENDIQIMKEVETEFSCEGKSLPWMNRLAVRYNDLSIVANEVCPKYETTGKAADVRSKILNGGNWVKYSMK